MGETGSGELGAQNSAGMANVNWAEVLMFSTSDLTQPFIIHLCKGQTK